MTASPDPRQEVPFALGLLAEDEQSPASRDMSSYLCLRLVKLEQTASAKQLELFSIVTLLVKKPQSTKVYNSKCLAKKK